MNPHRTVARFAATTFVVMAYVALSAVSVGCGGGNETTAPPTTTVVAIFTPDDSTPADGSITLLPGTSSGGSVNVRVTVTQMASFFGAAFRIKYDATALRFGGMDDTTSFLRDGVTDPNQLFFSSYAANSPGEIVITATRLRPAVPVPLVSATDDLVILNFVARRAIPVGAVDGLLEFVAPRQACDGTVAADGCGSITVTAWNGGSVSAQ